MATVGAAVVGGRAVAIQSQKATSVQSSFWGERARPAKASATTSGSAAMPVVEANALVDRCSKSDIIVSPSILSANFAKLGEQCSHQFAPTLSSSSRSGGVKQRAVVPVRATNAEGPLRRPSTPGAAPSIATSPAPPSPPTSEPSPSPSPSQLSSSPAAPAKVTPSKSTAVSIEYQRQRAKELQEYFLDKKYEEQVRADRIFGWTRKNEITNGRWTMFGIAVGLLTEYATGSDFVEQLKIIVSNLGIAELD